MIGALRVIFTDPIAGPAAILLLVATSLAIEDWIRALPRRWRNWAARFRVAMTRMGERIDAFLGLDP